MQLHAVCRLQPSYLELPLVQDAAGGLPLDWGHRSRLRTAGVPEHMLSASKASAAGAAEEAGGHHSLRMWPQCLTTLCRIQ